MIVPIILAAGESTRMGSPKALLADGAGRVFVTRLVHTFALAGFRHVVVVTGALHARIVDAVARDAPAGVSVIFARNPEPSRGQLSSLLAGLDAAHTPGVRAVLVTLVDVPFTSPATVKAVVAEYERCGAAIVRPARNDEHGHPVLFDRSLFDELRHADPQQGAKAVVRAHADAIVNLQCTDGGAFADVDTRTDYERFVEVRRGS